MDTRDSHCLTRLPQAQPAYGRSSTQGAVDVELWSVGTGRRLGKSVWGTPGPGARGVWPVPSGEAEAGGAVAAYTACNPQPLLIPTCLESLMRGVRSLATQVSCTKRILRVSADFPSF